MIESRKQTNLQLFSHQNNITYMYENNTYKGVTLCNRSVKSQRTDKIFKRHAVKQNKMERFQQICLENEIKKRYKIKSGRKKGNYMITLQFLYINL